MRGRRALEQRKRPTCRGGRRPHRPEPGRLTCPNSGTPLKAKPGTVPLAQGVLTGEPTHLDNGGYTLRQQAERLSPGSPEHFRRGLPQRRCGGTDAASESIASKLCRAARRKGPSGPNSGQV